MTAFSFQGAISPSTKPDGWACGEMGLKINEGGFHCNSVYITCESYWLGAALQLPLETALGVIAGSFKAWMCNPTTPPPADKP
jgi:hypothetical protein